MADTARGSTVRNFDYFNTGQISCEAIHPNVLNVPIDVAVDLTYSRNTVNVYVAAKLLTMAYRGSSNISMTHLCEQVGLSEKTVKKSIDELESIGYVKQVKRWAYVPHNPNHPPIDYVGERPNVDEVYGTVSRIKDMYVFLESSWREYDAEGEEI